MNFTTWILLSHCRLSLVSRNGWIAKRKTIKVERYFYPLNNLMFSFFSDKDFIDKQIVITKKGVEEVKQINFAGLNLSRLDTLNEISYVFILFLQLCIWRQILSVSQKTFLSQDSSVPLLFHFSFFLFLSDGTSFRHADLLDKPAMVKKYFKTFHQQVLILILSIVLISIITISP